MSKEINKPKTKEPLMILLCGCKEKCFEQGKCWGHLEGVLYTPYTIGNPDSYKTAHNQL